MVPLLWDYLILDNKPSSGFGVLSSWRNYSEELDGFFLDQVIWSTLVFLITAASTKDPLALDLCRFVTCSFGKDGAFQVVTNLFPALLHLKDLGPVRIFCISSPLVTSMRTSRGAELTKAPWSSRTFGSCEFLVPAAVLGEAGAARHRPGWNIFALYLFCCGLNENRFLALSICA